MGETVTVKGKVYQIGEWYLNDEQEACTLISHGVDGFKVDIHGNFFNSIYLAVVESVGTITEAPLELEDECHYLCDFDHGKYQGAMYCVGDGLLVFGHDHSYPKAGVTVKPLYKMVKAND